MPRVDPRTGGRGDEDALTLVQYWDAEEIPDYLEDEFATFTDLNPDFRHVVFSRGAAEDFIADNFSSREVEAFRTCAVPSMQSDYLRFCVGLVFGGIYSDVDFRCVAPLRPLVPDAGRLRLFLGPRGNVISGIFAFRSPGHPFLELALEIATVNIRRRVPDTVYFAAGPPIFTALVALYHLRSSDGSIAPLEDPALQEAIYEYWKVIGDRDRVTAALDGVEVRPTREYLECVRPTGPLPYKSTDSHWLNFKGEIFETR